MPALDKARRLREQSGKFLAVTGYILSRYGKLVTSYDEVQDFFTEIYLRKKPAGAWQRELTSRTPAIATRTLDEIFPGIRNADVHRVARYESLTADYYRPVNEFLLSPRELLDLCAMVTHLGPRSLFEFGTYKGATTANLAINAPAGAAIHTLDWDPSLLQGQRIKDVFAEKRIERIVADSTRYDFSAFAGKMDFIFIDGGHTGPVARSDTRNALGMLAPGGTIVWHDFGPSHPEIVAFLLELAREIPLTHVEGTALIVHRSAVRLR